MRIHLMIPQRGLERCGLLILLKGTVGNQRQALEILPVNMLLLGQRMGSGHGQNVSST